MCYTTYSQCDMASYTLIKPVLSKDAESSCQSALQVRPLLVRVVKLWWLGKLQHLNLSIFLVQTRLVRCHRVRSGLVAWLRLDC